MKKSGRDSYGDDAIGYVQVKRQGDICIVKCRITPEHRVRKKPFRCSLECNEKEDEVLCVTCDDCAASRGGCKHAIALLMWLHRRTEEPSPTDVKCYWKKSKLAGVGTTEKFIKAKDFGAQLQHVGDESKQFFEKLVPKLYELNVECSLAQYVTEKQEVQKISMHYLICTFKQSAADRNVENFIKFCRTEMTDSRCLLVKNATKDQDKSNNMWFEMRYGRITASKMHEASQCKTKDGALVETIFGALKFKDTAAIKGEKILENDVIKVVSEMKKLKIEQSGLYLNNDWPMLVASPNGLTNDCVIEIKCPYTDKTMRTYYDNGQLGKKYYAQIQAQMHMSARQKGLFCVANVDFESSKIVNIYEVQYDKDFCKTLFAKCELFWKNNVYDKLVE
ncbi:hypothetical protein O0L34_g4143 [Tuta absoluta]|nr:hypothetical protein O0L34_g4143 [Tuta absoluta]